MVHPHEVNERVLLLTGRLVRSGLLLRVPSLQYSNICVGSLVALFLDKHRMYVEDTEELQLLPVTDCRYRDQEASHGMVLAHF